MLSVFCPFSFCLFRNFLNWFANGWKLSIFTCITSWCVCVFFFRFQLIYVYVYYNVNVYSRYKSHVFKHVRVSNIQFNISVEMQQELLHRNSVINLIIHIAQHVIEIDVRVDSIAFNKLYNYPSFHLRSTVLMQTHIQFNT